MGRDFKGLIEQGSIVGFSLRAQGNIVKDVINNNVVVQDPIQICTWDYVVNPSHNVAWLERVCEETYNSLIKPERFKSQVLALCEARNIFENGNTISLDNAETSNFIDYTPFFNKKSKKLSEVFFLDKENEEVVINEDGTVILEDRNTVKKVILEDFLIKDVRRLISNISTKTFLEGLETDLGDAAAEPIAEPEEEPTTAAPEVEREDITGEDEIQVDEVDEVIVEAIDFLNDLNEDEEILEGFFKEFSYKEIELLEDYTTIITEGVRSPSDRKDLGLLGAFKKGFEERKRNKEIKREGKIVDEFKNKELKKIKKENPSLSDKDEERKNLAEKLMKEKEKAQLEKDKKAKQIGGNYEKIWNEKKEQRQLGKKVKEDFKNLKKSAKDKANSIRFRDALDMDTPTLKKTVSEHEKEKETMRNMREKLKAAKKDGRNYKKYFAPKKADVKKEVKTEKPVQQTINQKALKKAQEGGKGGKSNV